MRKTTNKTETMQLRELQRKFCREVLFNESTGLASLIEPSGIEPHRRLQIYRNNIRFTLTESLQNIYPITQAIVGEEFFKYAAHEYIKQHQSTTGDLREYGDQFTSFIGVMKETQQIAYLASIAQVDWACHLAFHAKSAPTASIDSLKNISPEDYSRIKITLHPTVHSIASQFAIFDIWQYALSTLDNTDETEPPNITSEKQAVLVCRSKSKVEVMHIGHAVHCLISYLKECCQLTTAFERILEEQPEFEMQTALHRLFSFDAITSVTIE